MTVCFAETLCRANLTRLGTRAYGLFSNEYGKRQSPQGHLTMTGGITSLQYPNSQVPLVSRLLLSHGPQTAVIFIDYCDICAQARFGTVEELNRQA